MTETDKENPSIVPADEQAGVPAAPPGPVPTIQPAGAAALPAAAAESVEAVPQPAESAAHPAEAPQPAEAAEQPAITLAQSAETVAGQAGGPEAASVESIWPPPALQGAWGESVQVTGPASALTPVAPDALAGQEPIEPSLGSPLGASYAPLPEAARAAGEPAPAAGSPTGPAAGSPYTPAEAPPDSVTGPAPDVSADSLDHDPFHSPSSYQQGPQHQEQVSPEGGTVNVYPGYEDIHGGSPSGEGGYSPYSEQTAEGVTPIDGPGTADSPAQGESSFSTTGQYPSGEGYPGSPYVPEPTPVEPPADQGGGGPPPAQAASDDEDEDEPDDSEGAKMTLGEHLEELRTRLLRAIGGLVVAMILTMALTNWMLGILKSRWPGDVNVQSPTAGFATYFRVSLIAGLVLAAPWIFYQLWMFIAAGLYKHERRYVTRSVPFAAALFVMGACFFLFWVSRPMLRFLHGFNEWLGVKEVVMLDQFVEFMTNMMLVFGLAFQMPLLVFILGKVGILTIKQLRHFRRHVIIAILIFAMIVTPSPSPVDQMVLAIPMWLLYELGILLVWLSKRKEDRLARAEGEEVQKEED